MMTRAQLRFAGSAAGTLLALCAACFTSERLIRWFWAMPLMVLAGLLLMAGSERREMRRRQRGR